MAVLVVAGMRYEMIGGVLDLTSKGIGPSGLGDLASSFSRLTSLTLDSNGIFGELYSSGTVKEADKFAAKSEPFFAALKESQIAVLSLKGTGMGPVACAMLATSLSAAVTSLNILGNPIGGGARPSCAAQNRQPPGALGKRGPRPKWMGSLQGRGVGAGRGQGRCLAATDQHRKGHREGGVVEGCGESGGVDGGLSGGGKCGGRLGGGEDRSGDGLG